MSMSKDEKKRRIENIAEKFVCLDEEDKQYIAGYVQGVQEERRRWKETQAAGILA